MHQKRIHRLAAAGVFLYALTLYASTVAPTTSLWDSGEFIASAYGLQVMHPPGSPVYMLLGRLFSMFVPAGQVALAVNGLSVLAGALTVLLTYLIIIQFATRWHRQQRAESSAFWTATAGGVLGACTLAVTDSFWFNAVEAEVYALSMFFTALAVWLSLVWSTHVQNEAAAGKNIGWKSDRYLVLIAYVFGLAIGVHLMVLLAYFFIALIFYFTRIEKPDWPFKKRVFGLTAAGIVSVFFFAVIYPGVVIWLPEWAEQSGAPILFMFGLLSLLIAGLFYTQRHGRARVNLALLCLTALLAGYSAYALIPIRSAADPPIDLNDPETTEALVPYLKREQYGLRPLTNSGTFDNRTGTLDPDRNVVLFPRRNFNDPVHLARYARYPSDAAYFWRYQLGHMYARYFLWNFSGRAKDEQDAGWITGLSKRETDTYVYATPSESASRNAYFALPLLLGLLGMGFHFKRDGRRALAVLLLFLATGVGLVLYLNEVPRTPRERDYIYVASYFAFSLWIGLGAVGLLRGGIVSCRRWMRHRRSPAPSNIPASIIGATLAVVLFAAVPLWVLLQNYDDHDRSGRLLAREFAHNMLMSLDENAILFTEGDNDTYPLWYLQEVEGIRRDVRVVNLSLLNAPWYPRQLRDQWAYDAAPLPITLTDEELDAFQGGLWEPATVSLPVDLDRLVEKTEMQISVEDTSGFENPMRWTLQGRPMGEFRVLYPVDRVVLDILAGNAQQGWQRPIYFASTTAPSNQLDLQPYFQREGLAYRVVPIRHEEPFGRIVPDIMLDRLSKFKLSRLDDPGVYYDPSSRGLAGNAYRNTYTLTAATLAEAGRPQEARQLLDAFLDDVPPDTIPLTFYEAYPLTQTYRALGAEERVIELWRYAEPYALQEVQLAGDRQQLQQAIQRVQHIQLSYAQARAFDKAAALGNRLADLLNDDAFRLSPEEFEQFYEEPVPPRNQDTG
ncbi:MAG: DUF2723 domain-containing protein [Rhodothermales bacterium]